MSQARPRLSCERTAAWLALQSHFDSDGQHFDLRKAFAQDARRFDSYSIQAPHVFADLSKNLIDAQVQALLLRLALECALPEQRAAMLAGEMINVSERRAVKHWLLRTPRSDTSDPDAGAVHETLNAMLAFAEQVRGNPAITDVVNIGIGGSDLGPQMAVQALAEYATPAKRLHFVANVDGHELQAVLSRVRPESTLFVIASKSFTTTETLLNARSARAWFEAQGGQDIARHFVGLTVNTSAAAAFGITTCFGLWDWVGGRYSMWSSVGLPIAIAIGASGFRDMLAGAHAMDTHFATQPLEGNLPVRLALLDVWYRNFHGFTSRCIAPYHSGLRRLPAYLQQLEMESNGKRVDRSGKALAVASAPVIWGEPGTNGQHAYFQLLHQGTDTVPVEFLVARHSSHSLPGHHEQLIANALAQAQALMQGQADVVGYKHFPGNRPSTFFIIERLDPASLGALVALQEHRTFTGGAIWGINSFDQWGVELGKVLARDIVPRLQSGDGSGLDGSTAGLLERLRQA